MRTIPTRNRHAALTLESCFVLPVLFSLLLAIVVGGYGVIRYQEMALLAREGSRYASVHGGLYQQETGNPAATPQDVYNNAILPFATNLDPTKLSYSVTWNTSNMPTSATSDYEQATGNTVTVTVSYQWFPELFVVGPFTLTSTSTVAMAY
jgi:Flp pilus assembly protein TadG